MTLSKKQFPRGLVVGKFCPLHRGHELVIQRAMAECDEVIVVSYTKPEFFGCEPAKRKQWLTALFPTITTLVLDDYILETMCRDRNMGVAPTIPHNDAGDHFHRVFVGWLCCAMLQKTVDAVFTSQDYGDGFAARLTAYFQQHTQPAPTVSHVSVNRARNLVPISGTVLRTDPHANRRFLSPQVYGSFVERICFLGGESSGKTTLAAALAEKTKTKWVPEYGRELWEKQDGKLAFSDMLRIAETQCAREDDLTEQANRWLFCDTSPLTTLLYCKALFGSASEELESHASRHYQAIFLCAPDIEFVHDGTRRDQQFRRYQHDWYLHELRKRSIKFSLLSGSLDVRIATVVACIESSS